MYRIAERLALEKRGSGKQTGEVEQGQPSHDSIYDHFRKTSQMAHTFSILHISDLHECGLRERERARRYRVLGDGWKRNLDDLLREGCIDLVCFTGDLADCGLEDEYQQASRYLDEWLCHVGLPRERLFIVPGNHDINREIERSAWQELRKRFSRIPALDISRWMAGGEVPLGLEPGWRDAVLERQAAFRAWLKAFDRQDLWPSKSRHGRLGYHVPLSLPGIPFDIQIIGLDSAWLAGDDADSGKLRLTDGQILTLCAGVEGKSLDGFRLALMHHPLSDLADGGDCRKRMAESVDLLLRGHLHEAEPELWSDPDRSLRAFVAGCLYEGHRADCYPNACALIRVTCDDVGRPLVIDLRLRSFSSRGGHWFDDGGLYREAPTGRLHILLGDHALRSPQYKPDLRTAESASRQRTLLSNIDIQTEIEQIELLTRNPNRRNLRLLLGRLIRGDSRFTAFVQTYFSDIAECYSVGMDRINKTNILIESINEERIAIALLDFIKTNGFI